MDAFGLRCPRCKKPFSSDNADHLADTLLAHLEAEHGHAPPREHVLARIERHNPSSSREKFGRHELSCFR